MGNERYSLPPDVMGRSTSAESAPIWHIQYHPWRISVRETGRVIIVGRNCASALSKGDGLGGGGTCQRNRSSSINTIVQRTWDLKIFISHQRRQPRVRGGVEKEEEKTRDRPHSLLHPNGNRSELPRRRSVITNLNYGACVRKKKVASLEGLIAVCAV